MFATQEQAIIDRLLAKLPPTVHVAAVRDIEAVPQLRQRAPAAWVVYDGYRIGDRIPPGSKVQQVEQDWFVVVAAKSARGNGDTTAARDEASTLCEQVLGALLGFDLTGRGHYLRLQEAPGPEYDGGYCHVPLAFSCAATFRGQP